MLTISFVVKLCNLTYSMDNIKYNIPKSSKIIFNGLVIK